MLDLDNDPQERGSRWREALWWVALVVLMGCILALATLVNAR